MAWVRLEDDFYDHPRLLAVGPLGMAMWITGLAWSNRNLTDGLIPHAAVSRLIDVDGLATTTHDDGGDPHIEGTRIRWTDVSCRLIESGLWTSEAEGCRIWNYHKFQFSSEEVLADRDKRQELRRQRSTAGGKARSSTAGRDAAGHFISAGQSSDSTSPSSPPPAGNQPPTPTPTDKSKPLSIAYGEDFDLVWSIFPRKTAKGQSHKAYTTQRRKGSKADELLTSTRNYLKSRVGQDATFTMQASRFFGPTDEWREWLTDKVPADLAAASVSRAESKHPAIVAQRRRDEAAALQHESDWGQS